MYCALRLASKGYQIELLEASKDRWGRRMETGVLDGFITEWGPMRFEKKLQPKFGALMDGLNIELDNFVGPTSSIATYPQYDLKTSDQNLDALGLLRRGTLLIMGIDPNDPFDYGGQNWIDSLTESDYRKMRKEAKLNGKYLWTMGFWNALSADGILSHQAIMKIRDSGTFYHMIPNNLNAIEWIIWWLRALKTEGQELSTIKKGTAEITTQMLARLQAFDNVQLSLDSRLQHFEAAHVGNVSIHYSKAGETVSTTADHLILALPKHPLLQLEKSLPPTIFKHLDKVNGFPMLKIFFILKEPWWDYDQSPQARSNRMPTRELHYFRRNKYNDYDKKGMILVYTDRPATEFWKYYVQDQENHDRAEINQNDEIKEQFATFMVQDVYRSVQSNEAMSGIGLRLTQKAYLKYYKMNPQEIKEDIMQNITEYGIRDWGRAPYGAGNLE